MFIKRLNSTLDLEKCLSITVKKYQLTKKKNQPSTNIVMKLKLYSIYRDDGFRVVRFQLIIMKIVIYLHVFKGRI